MRFFTRCLLLLLAASPGCARYSFQNDIIRQVDGRNQLELDRKLNDELLSMATLVAPDVRRKLNAADDYLTSEDSRFSFQGYSLKYVKCQTIKRFSEDAVKNGEYSAMVADDLVILRLCPYKTCSESKQYGCYYNYAEYALNLSDYIKVMLRYTMEKKENLCTYCQTCNNRRLEGDNAENNANNNNEGGEGTM